MPFSAEGWPVTPAGLRRLMRDFGRAWGVRVYAVLPGGGLALGKPPCKTPECDACRAARRLAVNEALRWGEPSVEFCPSRRLLWAVPVMCNQELLGGIVCEAVEGRVFPADPATPPLDVRGACAALLRMAEARNLANAALLEARRLRHGEERLRAEAIHAYKEHGMPDLRAACLREEEALLDAVRGNDPGAARAALNRTVVAIHFHAGRRLDVLKSFCLELGVTLSRTAVEAGGNPAPLLGEQFEHMTALAAMDSEEELLAWLGALLSRVLDSLAALGAPGPHAACQRALAHMRRHFSGPLTRGDAARAAGVSVSHLSRLFRRHAGCGFAEMLIRMRVNKARELLARTDKELCLVALECGFADQSHFQNVFRRATGETPGRYRAARRGVGTNLQSSGR